jgi:lipopolysaccharide export system permease protein
VTRVPKLIHRYVFSEILPPALVTFLVLSAVFLMTQMLQLANLVVNHRVGIVSVLLLLAFAMPFFLQFVFPMATMMGVLLAFLRMSQDNETAALKAGGIGLGQILPPVLAFSLAAMALCAFVSVKALPLGRLAAKALLLDVARKNIELGIREGAFNDTFKDVVLYVGQVEPASRKLSHVFIEDRRRPGTVLTIIAGQGELVSNPDRTVWHLRLKDGMVDQVRERDQTVYSLHFETYDFRVDLTRVLGGAGDQLDEEEMTLAQLRGFLRNRTQRDDKYYMALLELHKKFAMPFACVVMGVLGIPLGIVSRSSRRSFGVGLGLAFFLLYYLILSAGWVFGESGAYPPALGMWMPNAVLLAVAVILFRRADQDRPVRLLESVREMWSRLSRAARQGDPA